MAASNASKIMLFILSFRCSNGDGQSQWLSPFSFAGLRTKRRAKLICESPSSAKRIKRILPSVMTRGQHTHAATRDHHWSCGMASTSLNAGARAGGGGQNFVLAVDAP